MVEGRKWRRALAGVAVIAAAGGVVACGSDDDNGDAKATAAKTETTAPASETTATTPAPATTVEDDPITKAEKAPNGPLARGTTRLAAQRLGTPGIMTITPKGEKYGPVDYWYPKGTKVTLRVKNRPNAIFAEWAGACTGKARVCRVTMDQQWVRVLAGFNPKNVKKAK